MVGSHLDRTLPPTVSNADVHPGIAGLAFAICHLSYYIRKETLAVQNSMDLVLLAPPSHLTYVLKYNIAISFSYPFLTVLVI